MQRLIFGLAVLGLLISTSLQAQSEQSPDAFALRYIGSNFQWPLEQVDALNLNDFERGLEFEYFRYLNDAFDLSIPLRLASGNLPQTADGTVTRESGNMARLKTAAAPMPTATATASWMRRITAPM
ncbi:MAG: hypothetical protein H6566_26540 [Lewinellaceae bacterium]|nr:hypothetical protein [Lewinellaceae bacterium]